MNRIYRELVWRLNASNSEKEYRGIEGRNQGEQKVQVDYQALNLKRGTL